VLAPLRVKTPLPVFSQPAGTTDDSGESGGVLSPPYEVTRRESPKVYRSTRAATTRSEPMVSLVLLRSSVTPEVLFKTH